ncbi:MAG: hypothetical protein CR975_04640 [Gammaproteobacteria bacterium]|nr:MAG: hypothetical protein CR975_04640 [Gammaproteobacteria bacterium]
MKTFRWVMLLIISFLLGYQCYKFVYDDICLDMGGGKHPGNHPICVIEVPKP